MKLISAEQLLSVNTDKPYPQGIEAALDKKSGQFIKNPYEPGTSDHEDWHFGFLKGLKIKNK